MSPETQRNKNSDDWKSPPRLEERNGIKLKLASMTEQLTEAILNRLSYDSFLLVQTWEFGRQSIIPDNNLRICIFPE